MVEASLLFRITMVVILVVFAILFAALFIYDRKERTSYWIAIAFTSGLSAFLFDLGRSLFNPTGFDVLAKLFFWGFSIAWTMGIKEYLREELPFKVTGMIVVVGGFFLFWFSAIENDIIVRSIASSITAGSILAVGLPSLWRHKSNPIETALFIASAGLCALYFIRPTVVYGILGHSYTVSSYGSSSYASLLHASSALFALACGATILLAIGHKMIDKHLRESVRDPLTKLRNRRGLDQYVTRELEGPRSVGRAILIVDLDHFKQVNDRYGHEVGDQVLVRSATELDNLVKGLGVVSRIGGEEFVVILDKLKSEDIHTIAQHIRLSMGMITHPEIGERSSVTASVGLALISGQESFSMALRRADQALYKAKTSGRNQLFLAVEDKLEQYVRLA
ncbi:MAG: GGDEF domain-containing protein [Parasphingorhabdus sp.]